VRDRLKAETILVSRASGPHGAKGNGSSYGGSLSADGGLVAFESKATNLSRDAGGGHSDVYVRDLASDETTLVSRATGKDSTAGNKGSFRASMAADGRFLAFSSFASNLTPDDPDVVEDVFVRNLTAHETALVSRASGDEGAKGDGGSTRASLSDDGRFVAFDSFARNLSSDDRDGGTDVFVRDLAEAETTLVSRANGVDGAKSNLASLSASLSADGRFVAFASFASNLSRDDRDSLGDVYLRDVRGAPPRCAEITRELRGSERADALTGSADADLMFGLGGNDRLSGLDGGDCLFGGSGDDALAGGERGDDLRGGPGNDVLDGGAGSDQLYGGPGVNRYSAGAGDDFVLASNGRRETVDCGSGRDEVRADRSDRVRRCEQVSRSSR
jgi:Tol biopolymer transport system component